MSHENNKIQAKSHEVAAEPEFRNDSDEARTLPLLSLRRQYIQREGRQIRTAVLLQRLRPR